MTSKKLHFRTDYYVFIKLRLFNHASGVLGAEQHIKMLDFLRPLYCNMLASRWIFDTKDGNTLSPVRETITSLADVDENEKDEIVYGSMLVDGNGKDLFCTGFRHGDALHVSDLDPDSPGLEVFGLHEIEDLSKGDSDYVKDAGPGLTVYSARTGEVHYKGATNTDVGAGMAENIDPDNAGAEMWWSGRERLPFIKGENRPYSYRLLFELVGW